MNSKQLVRRLSRLEKELANEDLTVPSRNYKSQQKNAALKQVRGYTVAHVSLPSISRSYEIRNKMLTPLQKEEFVELQQELKPKIRIGKFKHRPPQRRVRQYEYHKKAQDRPDLIEKLENLYDF